MDKNKQEFKNHGTKVVSKQNIKQIIKPNIGLSDHENKKKDAGIKGFKKYTQGYTMNKIAKENSNKVDSYVKVINKSKLKRPNSSK